MFDVRRAIAKSRLPKSEVEKLEREIRMEFPHDEMMYELHMIRALEYEKKHFVRAKK